MIWLNLLNIFVASNTVGVDPALMYSLCHTETRIRNVINKYDGGSPSYGICQVKLNTARQFFSWIESKHLMNVYVNTFVAATYLKYQSERFKSPLKGISAYNAGRPIKSNVKYVNKVLNTLRGVNEANGDIAFFVK